MNTLLILLLIAVVVTGLQFAMERKALKFYLSRVCTGFHWRRRFPEASKAEIRSFLDVFISSFCFDKKWRLRFAPDDKVMDVYRALNPLEGMPDSMELEGLTVQLEERYGVDFAAIWNENITLGDLFTHAKTASSCRRAQ
ncbi:MAG: hypothetical protein HY300_05640 [Verrucomicrobia bacterium]|nr:hypothetical protein [Verrucomicrobiota bacterium]